MLSTANFQLQSLYLIPFNILIQCVTGEITFPLTIWKYAILVKYDSFPTVAEGKLLSKEEKQSCTLSTNYESNYKKKWWVLPVKSCIMNGNYGLGHHLQCKCSPSPVSLIHQIPFCHLHASCLHPLLNPDLLMFHHLSWQQGCSQH